MQLYGHHVQFVAGSEFEELVTSASSVIGQHIGAKDYDGAQRSVYLTLSVALVYSLFMIALFVGFAGPLTRVFSSGFQDTGCTSS